MTTKMQSCVDHIKTSVDVDPWAAEMVEKIFAEYDRRFDNVLEIIERLNHNGSVSIKLLRKELIELKEGEQE